VCRRQLPQLVVDQRQQPAGHVRVALTQGAQKLGDSFVNLRDEIMCHRRVRPPAVSL
jgi:hypothetical protein